MLATVLSSNAHAGVQQTRILDSFNAGLGTPPSLAFSPDGIPTVAYYDPDVASLRVVTCNGPNCTSTDSNNIIAGIENGVAWPSMRFNPGGNPVIAYWDDFSIDVARCADPTCNAITSVQSVGSGQDVFGIPAMTLNESGFPTIAFLNSDFEVNIVHCLTRSCSQTSPTWIPVPGEVAGAPPSIEVHDGRIVVVYVTSQPDGSRPIRAIACHNNSCADPERHVLSGFFLDGNVATGSSDPSRMFIGGARVNVETGNGLHFVEELLECRPFTDPCQSGLTNAPRISFPDGARPAGQADVTIDSNGRPVVAFIDIALTGSLHVASSPTDGNGGRVVAPDPSITTAFGPDIEIFDGRAAIAVSTDQGLHLTVCDDERCVPRCLGQLATVDIGVGGELGTPETGDIVNGTAGDDVIEAGSTVCARGGNDTISGIDRGGRIFAGQGNDVIEMNYRGFVSGGPGDDLIIGSVGSDNIQGGPGRDTIRGRPGNDRISGGSGNDILDGGVGNDELLGTLGRDTLDGGAGNDILRGGGWIDELDGGPGTDDRCSTVPGERRINCERGIFGI